MPQLTSALIGATGLIGSHLLELLVNDDTFTKVRLLVRRPLAISHPKVEVLVVDFSSKAAITNALAGCDAVFCSVGTTQKKVKGDKVEYRKVDYDIPVSVAEACVENCCRHFLLVSSVGANARGGNFYLKLKGEVEEKVQTFGIPFVSVFRPSMLLGKRHESRPMESIAQVISKPLSFLFPSKYKPIAAADVARAMVAASKLDAGGVRIYHYREMISLLA